MSDSVRPHRRQPTRLPRPWDSPGKNTGVGCHFLLQNMKVKSESEVAQSCLTLGDPGLQPTRLLRPWDSPGKSTGVGCHCLLRYFQLDLYNSPAFVISFWDGLPITPRAASPPYEASRPRGLSATHYYLERPYSSTPSPSSMEAF